MRWARISLAAAFALGAPAAGHALSQVSGPVQIGPSGGDGDAPNHAATLTTTLVNRGGLPDRLLRVTCPGIGRATLLDGAAQPAGNAPQAGLDLPGTRGGQASPVVARIGLSEATQPMAPGALVPCALYFAHAGQRIVVFTLGARDPAVSAP